MAGRNNAVNLTGMLSQMNDAISGFGEAGNQYVDTFRRSMAPKPDMNDSKSLLNYAQWARRNGYDEEAEKYLAMGYNQQKIEQEKEYKTGTAKDAEKLRGYTTSIDALTKVIGEYENSDVFESDVGPVPNPRLENAKMALQKVEGERQLLVQGMNDRGDASNYGTGNEGNVAERQLITEEAAAQKAALEMQKLQAQAALEKDKVNEKVAEGELIPPDLLPHIDYKKYELRLSQAQTVADRRRINKSIEDENTKWGKAKEAQNAAVAQQQIKVIFKELDEEGRGSINDDDLTDFLQDDLSAEARKQMNSVITAYAISDSRWIKGDRDQQKKIIEEIFVREYSDFYSKDFGESFEKREAGKSLRESDATANYPPGMNPTAVMPDGSPNQFEQFYQIESATDPNYTREQALKEWDDNYNLNNKKEEEPRPVRGYHYSNKAGRPIRKRAVTGPPTTGNFSNKAGR